MPLKFRVLLVEALLHVFVFFVPKYKRIAAINLKIAFPDKDDEWRKSIIKRSVNTFAWLIVDSARLSALDKKWADEHVKFEGLERYQELKAESQAGIILASGHISSFELMAYSASLKGFPVSFIVRNFKSPRLDRWWISHRERHGNRVIFRKGAYKKILEQLKNGEDVGILFDQNVTRNQAIFVDFFGLQTATAFALGHAAVTTKAPILFAFVLREESGKYLVKMKEHDFSDLYRSESLDNDAKAKLITQTITRDLEQVIRENPASWFWMHRRWKTRPSEDEAGIYDDI